MFPLTVTLQIQTAAQLTALAAALSGSPLALTPSPMPTKAPSPQPDKAETPAATPAPTKAPSPPPPPAADEVLDYNVLRTAVFKLVELSPKAAGELNAEFGVKTMKDLDPAKRHEALARVKARIAELENAA